MPYGNPSIIGIIITTIAKKHSTYVNTQFRIVGITIRRAEKKIKAIITGIKFNVTFNAMNFRFNNKAVQTTI
jgi:hypothetical protein